MSQRQLGEQEIERLHQLLRRMRDKGMAILYVSHRLDEVERIVDEVTILRGGKVVRASGETEIDVQEIVFAMVGSNLGEHYPKEKNFTDNVIFEAQNLKTSKGIEDVSFYVKEGEVFGLGGVLGGGGTEIAHALFGVDKLLDGKITLNGKVVNIQNERDAILGGLALIPENRKFDGLFFNFRASGNITAASLNSLSRFGILDLKRKVNDGTFDFTVRNFYPS